MTHRMAYHVNLLLAVTSGLALLAGQAAAGGFMLREGSASAIGAALAGRTSGDRDVSFSIHNPASLRGVENFEVSAGGAALFASGDSRTSAALPGFTSKDSPSEDAIIPSFAVGYRLNDKLVLGLAVDSPFGLASEYDANFVGSFDGVRSELTTITATPMVSYDVTPGFTLAGGVMIQYADAELQSRVGAGPNAIANVSGDGFDVGFTLGALIEPVEGTVFGVNVQSGFKHKLDGSFSDNFPGVGGRSGTASFDLPAVVSVGLTQRITDDVRAMAEIEFADWSAFDAIVIKDKASGAVVANDVQNYSNSVMVALGAEYDFSSDLTLRAGLAYDQTPTDGQFRTVRVPDGHRWWFAVGASYEITESIGIDAGYLYLTIADNAVTLRNGPAAGASVSNSDADVHLFSANLRYKF